MKLYFNIIKIQLFDPMKENFKWKMISISLKQIILWETISVSIRNVWDLLMITNMTYKAEDEFDTGQVAEWVYKLCDPLRRGINWLDTLVFHIQFSYCDIVTTCIAHTFNKD